MILLQWILKKWDWIAWVVNLNKEKEQGAGCFEDGNEPWVP
jgi:hypothetical protein